jgi:hypothetical protein
MASKRWMVQDGKFVYVEADSEVADADTLGEIIDELQCALREALDLALLGENQFGKEELNRIVELRAKFLAP